MRNNLVFISGVNLSCLPRENGRPRRSRVNGFLQRDNITFTPLTQIHRYLPQLSTNLRIS